MRHRVDQTQIPRSWHQKIDHFSRAFHQCHVQSNTGQNREVNYLQRLRTVCLWSQKTRFKKKRTLTATSFLGPLEPNFRANLRLSFALWTLKEGRKTNTNKCVSQNFEVAKREKSISRCSSPERHFRFQQGSYQIRRKVPPTLLRKCSSAPSPSRSTSDVGISFEVWRIDRKIFR